MIIKYIGITAVTVGAILLLCTAGASDQDMIGLEQIAQQLLLALTAIGGGTVCIKIGNILEYQERQRERNHKYEHYHH